MIPKLMRFRGGSIEVSGMFKISRYLRLHPPWAGMKRDSGWPAQMLVLMQQLTMQHLMRALSL